MRIGLIEGVELQKERFGLRRKSSKAAGELRFRAWQGGRFVEIEQQSVFQRRRLGDESGLRFVDPLKALEPLALARISRPTTALRILSRNDPMQSEHFIDQAH